MAVLTGRAGGSRVLCESFCGQGDVRVQSVPDPEIKDPTDAFVRITHACICGSDLWFYRGYEPDWKPGFRTGHEWMGVVEEVGKEVMGHNAFRPKLGERFGATDIISTRDDAQAIAEAVQLTEGGAESVAECVGLRSSINLAIGVARPGGVVGFVGVPHVSEAIDLDRSPGPSEDRSSTASISASDQPVHRVGIAGCR
jgi:threonine dehydrogenase-like Zn-dependent dehydrogenase